MNEGIFGFFILLLFSCSVVSGSLRPHGLQHTRLPCPSPSPGLRLMSIESVMPSSHLILCHPLLLLPSIFPSIGVFSNESALHIMRPKYCSFSISPFSEYSGLISFKIDCFFFPCCPKYSQESSPAPQFESIITFFMVLISHLYMTAGKSIALTRRTSVGNVSTF